MKSDFSTRLRQLFDRFRVRISIGIAISLLVHAYILFLKLGIPGVGLPTLKFPQQERVSQTSQLNVRIVKPALSTGAPPAPAVALPPESSDVPHADLLAAQVKQAPIRKSSDPTLLAKALKSTPAIAKMQRMKGAPPTIDQSSLEPAHAQTEIIALQRKSPSAFKVPVPDPSTVWREAPKTNIVPLPTPRAEAPAPTAIALESKARDFNQSSEPVPALQKPTQKESFEPPEEKTAKEPIPTKVPDIVIENAPQKQGEEIVQQDVPQKAQERPEPLPAKATETSQPKETFKREAEEAARAAEQKQEELKVAKAAEELAIKKQEEMKAQLQAEAARREKELEASRQSEEAEKQKAAANAQKQIEMARKQVEDARKQEQAKEEQRLAESAQKKAEEIARQKAIAEERRRQEEQLAAQQKALAQAAQQKALEQAAEQKALDQAARQKAEHEAAQRENARLAAAAASAAGTSSGNNGGNKSGQNGTTNPSRSAGSGNLIGSSLDKIGKLDLSGDSSRNIEGSRSSDEPPRPSLIASPNFDIGKEQYIMGWRLKIERNGSLNYSQSSKDKAREDPVVTVVIRSDGSVRDIIFNRRSGRADLDEDVRRIVNINAPYSVFPANLARKYEEIPIRLIWNFEDRLRLIEEVH